MPTTATRYGQTGSGKSHSMIGTDLQPGLVPRIADHLFDSMQRAKAAADAADPVTNADGTRRTHGTTTATVSCVEIYNENLRDLLATPGSGSDEDEPGTSGGYNAYPNDNAFSMRGEL